MGKLKNSLPEEFFDQLELEQEHDCQMDDPDDSCIYHQETYEDV